MYNRISTAIGAHDGLLSIVKKRRMVCYGHVTRSNGLVKNLLQDTVPGSRKKGRQKKRWKDNIKEGTELSFCNSERRLRSLQMAGNCQEIVNVASTTH